MNAVALAELTDADLIDRIRGGARADFEVLVRRHNQRLFRAARGIVRSDLEAEDVVQQTWLDVFRHLDQFRGDAAFTTWATRICIHAALAHVRKQPPIAEVVDAPDHITPTPATTAERGELSRVLEQCLQQLPQGGREVVILRDVLELDTAETAACLGISE
jgi:RNA polymerase sigma-70 factor (ECF subfamily)